MSLVDLLIGLIFIFIILLVASALSAKRLQFELDERPQLRLRLLNDLRDDMAKHGVDVIVDGGNGILRLPEDALFASGEADIGKEGRDALQRLAAALARRLPCYGSQESRTHCTKDSVPILEAVYVEGHTDNIRIASARFPSNWELSSARAINTYQTLLQGAPPLRTIQNAQGTATLLGVSAYADQRPVRDHATKAHRDENRRIDLRFLLSPTKGS